MKSSKVLIILAWLFVLPLTQVLAQTFQVKTYKITVNGTSSLHDWESTVKQLEAKGSFVVTDNALTDIRDVAVKIPVTSIKSTKGKMMDNKTYDAFNHEKHPNITFLLTNRKVNAANSTLNVSGNLTMAGVTKPIEMTLTYKLLANGDLMVSGARKLNMTDFKMEPPTAMMGAIVVGDEVTVSFELVLSQSSMVKTSK